MIRIALADDHQLVLDGLKSLIKDEPAFEIVVEATNGRQLVELVSVVEVDVAMVDIDMPVMNGLTAIEHIRKAKPETKCIALTMHNEKGMIQKVIAAGASGYLLKNIDHEALVSAIKKVAAGGTAFSDEVTLVLAGKQGTAGLAFVENEFALSADLTEREIEVLKLIAQGGSNKEIGDSLFISHRTVDTHRTNLMKKLNVHNIAGLIRYAIRAGYAE